MRNVAISILCFALSISACRAEGKISRSYAASLPVAAEAINQIEQLPGGHIDVTLDHRVGQVVVQATVEQHEVITSIFEALNVDPLLIRVTIEISETDIIMDYDSVVSVRKSGRAREKQDRNKRKTLLIPDGAHVSVVISPKLPNVAWLMEYGIRNGHFEEGLATADVAAFVRVHVRSVDDGMVWLKFVPELRDPAAPIRDALSFDRLAQSYTVRDGTTLDLGIIEAHNEFYRKFLVGVDRRGLRRQFGIRAAVDIEGPGAPAQGSSKSQIKGK